METVKRLILKRVDGAYCNLRFEPVKSIRTAARFHDMDDFNGFMTGHYKPDHPEMYYAQTIKVTYEEVENDERKAESVPEN